MSTIAVLNVLDQFTNWTQYLVNTRLHPLYFPYPLLSCLHAARVSSLHQIAVRNAGTRSRLPRVTYIAGFLLMAWGGTTATHALIGIRPPFLVSIHPWINYITIHVVLSSFFAIFPFLLHAATLDFLCVVLDALLRTMGMTLAIKLLLHNPSTPAALSGPWTTQLLLGALASGSGGILAGTFSVWNPRWGLSIPPSLSGGVIKTMDVWGGALTALAYGILSLSHPSYKPLHTQLVSFVDLPQASSKAPPLTDTQARSAAALFFASLFLVKAIVVHLLTRKSVSVEKKRQ